MLDHIESKLLIDQIVRTILSLMILFGTDLPLFVKIIFIFFFDILDEEIPFYMKTPQKYIPFYQYIDKISDTIIYIFLWIYFLKYEDTPETLKIYVSILFFYRLLGIILFLKDNNRSILMYFPNFFFETLFCISLLETFGYSYPEYKNLYILIFFGVILFKMNIELWFHGGD